MDELCIVSWGYDEAIRSNLTEPILVTGRICRQCVCMCVCLCVCVCVCLCFLLLSVCVYVCITRHLVALIKRQS